MDSLAENGVAVGKDHFDKGAGSSSGPWVVIVSSIVSGVVGWSIPLVGDAPPPPTWVTIAVLCLAALVVVAHVTAARSTLLDLRAMAKEVMTRNRIATAELVSASRSIGGMNRIISERDLDPHYTLDEPDGNGCRSEYRGDCYVELVKLIESSHDIFVIPNPFGTGEIGSWEAAPRRRYLEALEKRVLEDDSFRYTRIQQVPAGSQPEEHFGASASAHIRRLQRRTESRVKLLFVESEETSGFMIIDERVLVKFITGVNSRGQRNLVALSIQENPGSTEVIEFCRNAKENLLTLAQPIKRLA